MLMEEKGSLMDHFHSKTVDDVGGRRVANSIGFRSKKALIFRIASFLYPRRRRRRLPIHFLWYYLRFLSIRALVLLAIPEVRISNPRWFSINCLLELLLLQRRVCGKDISFLLFVLVDDSSIVIVKMSAHEFEEEVSDLKFVTSPQHCSK
jgi:hypothetical protein